MSISRPCTTPNATGPITPIRSVCRSSLRELDASLMTALWNRIFRKPMRPPIQAIVSHFNEAAGDEEHFPSTIDPRIYHVQLILEYFGDLNGKRILDVGCGKGRFARVFLDRYPQAGIVAFD